MKAEVLTVKQLMEVLQLGRKQAYELINSGQIYSVRINTAIRIPRWAVNQYLGIDEIQTYPIKSEQETIQSFESFRANRR